MVWSIGNCFFSRRQNPNTIVDTRSLAVLTPDHNVRVIVTWIDVIEELVPVLVMCVRDLFPLWEARLGLSNG